MKRYIVDGSKVHFRQGTLPVMWNVTMSQLGVYVYLTGDKRYPYAVELSESEFLSVIELAQ